MLKELKQIKKGQRPHKRTASKIIHPPDRLQWLPHKDTVPEQSRTASINPAHWGLKKESIARISQASRCKKAPSL